MKRRRETNVLLEWWQTFQRMPPERSTLVLLCLIAIFGVVGMAVFGLLPALLDAVFGR